MKKVLKVLGILLLIVILAFGGMIGFLTFTEFNPLPHEETAVESGAKETVTAGSPLTLLTWNIGYGGLGKDSDFFMDGGKSVRAANNAMVNENLAGIRDLLEEEDADLVLLQETDFDSTRSFRIDESSAVLPETDGIDRTFAKNYFVSFVPYPIPPIGKVDSGLFTYSDYRIEKAERISLPCPFTWPVRTANLKRCLLVNYLPVEGSDKKLVLINLHLEAYDSGEGKTEQTKQLMQLISSEYGKGNYVIVGGDFNQTLPDTRDLYPDTHTDLWAVGKLEEESLPEGFAFAYDSSSPTCRLLNQPYDPSAKENTQYYVIDGFILSPNVELKEVKTLSEDFRYTDHNPVRIRVELKAE